MRHVVVYVMIRANTKLTGAQSKMVSISIKVGATIPLARWYCFLLLCSFSVLISYLLYFEHSNSGE